MQHKRIRQNFMVFRLINRKNLKGLCDKWKNFLELNQGFVAMKTSVKAGGRGDQGAYRDTLLIFIPPPQPRTFRQFCFKNTRF